MNVWKTVYIIEKLNKRKLMRKYINEIDEMK